MWVVLEIWSPRKSYSVTSWGGVSPVLYRVYRRSWVLTRATSSNGLKGLVI